MTQATAQKTQTFNLMISRKFNAPRSTVFKTWTKSRHLINWWGPKDFTMPIHKMDIHPGGIYRCDLKGPDGKDHWVQGVYKEMIEPSHLAFTHSWNEDGKLTPETLVTIEFTEENGKTNMVFHQAGFNSESERDGHNEGWSSSFDRLDKYLTTDIDE